MYQYFSIPFCVQGIYFFYVHFHSQTTTPFSSRAPFADRNLVARRAEAPWQHRQRRGRPHHQLCGSESEAGGCPGAHRVPGVQHAPRSAPEKACHDPSHVYVLFIFRFCSDSGNFFEFPGDHISFVFDNLQRSHIILTIIIICPGLCPSSPASVRTYLRRGPGHVGRRHVHRRVQERGSAAAARALLVRRRRSAWACAVVGEYRHLATYTHAQRKRTGMHRLAYGIEYKCY